LRILEDLFVPDHEPPIANVVPPHIQLIQMGQAAIVSRIVYAAAKLSLADQLALGPKSAAELAGGMQVHAPSLHRLMRTLASLGVLTEQPEQRFALTDLGQALKARCSGLGKIHAVMDRRPRAAEWLGSSGLLRPDRQTWL
jgi:Dimerisation domain